MPGFRLERRPLGALALAILVIGWRILSHPPAHLWRDWIFILGCYGAYTTLASKSRAWPTVTSISMAFLLGIYIQGQLLYTLSIWGFGP